MKIDVHVHVTPPDIIRDYKKISEKEPYFEMLSNSPHNKFAATEEVINEMDACGFDKSVIFGFGFKDIGLCRYANDYVAESVRRFPDRLIGFLVAPPSDKEAEREVYRSFENGLRGAGELFTHSQKFDVTDNGSISSFMGACKELSLPVMLHTNEPIGHYYLGKVNLPLSHIETFIKNNPGLKVILAHFGGGILFYELMKSVRRAFKDVYYDTAAMPFLYQNEVYKAIEEIGIADKLLFGSDFPLLSPNRYDKGLGESKISSKTKEMILGGNAAKLFNL